jgi:ATP-dependent DNA ligase
MIAKALHTLPDETIVDGEVAVLDAEGRPSFELIQNHKSLKGTLVYFAFDLIVFRREHLTERSLDERKALLEEHLVPRLIEPLRRAEQSGNTRSLGIRQGTRDSIGHLAL